MTAFDIIKAARALLPDMATEAEPSRKTASDYESMARRFIGNGIPDIEEIIGRLATTAKKNTWFKRRAAILYSAKERMQGLLKAQDAIQRQLRTNPDPELQETWEGMIESLAFFTALVDAMPSGCPIPEADKKPRHSKRTDMGGLPQDWRERLLDRLPSYRLPYLAAAITGCRPDEIKKGVTFTLDGGDLVATIQGSKVTAKTAQPVRELTWTLPTTGMVDMLAEEVRRSGGELMVSIEDTKKFSDAVRMAGKREWPGRKKDMRPYCLRHQFSADMKASGASDEDISKAMGHVSVSTAEFYGTAKQVRGSVVPERVWAERAVRKASHQRDALRHFPIMK